MAVGQRVERPNNRAIVDTRSGRLRSPCSSTRLVSIQDVGLAGYEGGKCCSCPDCVPRWIVCSHTMDREHTRGHLDQNLWFCSKHIP